MGKLIHSVTVEHASEHEVVCGSEPAGEKRGKDETVAEQQSSRASGCEAAEMTTWSSRNTARMMGSPRPGARSSLSPFLARQIAKWFTTVPPKLLQEQPAKVHYWID
jgi:hypothetical protein